MNSKHILLFSLAVAALLAAGCNKTTEQTPAITLTGNSAQLVSSGISATAEGGDVKLTFTSGADWTIEIAPLTKAMVPWVVATPASGKAGEQEVLVSVMVNEELTARQANLSIKSGTLSTDIAIKQAARARIPVSEVTLNETSIELVNGENAQLIATVTPSYTDDDKTVTWSSSKPGVATVDQEGMVLSVAEGTTVITAAVGAVKATCEVVVLHKAIPLEGISLDKEELEIVNGSSYQLTATLTPANADIQTIEWSSSDEAVISVTDGLVEALSEGEATVTATAGSFSATCKVTVLHLVIEVESVTLNKNNVEFFVGDSETLVATINPADADDQSIVWSTSDASVVSVQDGVITGEGEGTATVTATAGNGKYATCTVQVSPKVIPVESVSLDQEKATIKVGKTVTLIATINPSYATDKSLTWQTSDNKIATVADGIVTGVAEGKVTITVTTSNGKTATCEVTVLPKGSNGEDLGDPIEEDPWE